MQVLNKPGNSSVLCALETGLLNRVGLVTTGSKAVNQTRVVVVLVWNSQGWDGSIAEVLQLWGEHLVGLGGKDLNRYSDLLNLFLCEQRRVCGGDGVYELVVL